MPARKLSDADVLAIRRWNERRKSIGTYKDQARLYGVSYQLIERICADPDYRAGATPQAEKNLPPRVGLTARSMSVRSDVWTTPSRAESERLAFVRSDVEAAADRLRDLGRYDSAIRVSQSDLALLIRHPKYARELGFAIDHDAVSFESHPLTP